MAQEPGDQYKVVREAVAGVAALEEGEEVEVGVGVGDEVDVEAMAVFL